MCWLQWKKCAPYFTLSEWVSFRAFEIIITFTCTTSASHTLNMNNSNFYWSLCFLFALILCVCVFAWTFMAEGKVELLELIYSGSSISSDKRERESCINSANSCQCSLDFAGSRASMSWVVVSHIFSGDVISFGIWTANWTLSLSAANWVNSLLRNWEQV